MGKSDRENRDEIERQLITRRELMVKSGGAAGALGLAWLLAACGGEEAASPSEAPAGSGTEPTTPASSTATETVPAGGGAEVDSMSWVINGEAVAMDYALAYDFNTNVAMTNITEPLLRYSPEGQLVPNLAESWEQ